jgi:hypothetical protein
MAYIDRNIYGSIKGCLIPHGFGELRRPALNHACGQTTTNILVWLPLLGAQIPYNNCPVDDDKYIVERNDNDGVGTIYAGTFIRERTGRGLYTYLGQYRVVLCDTNKRYKIHAKIDLPDAQGDVKHSGDLCWLSGFASNESEARAKLQRLINLANHFDRDKWLKN